MPDTSPFKIDPNRTPRQLRIDGTLLVLLSLLILGILCLVIGAHLGLFDLFSFLPGTYSAPSEVAAAPSPGTKLLLILAIAFGCFGLAEGLWRIEYGKRNTLFMRVLIAIAVLFFIAGAIVMVLQGGRIRVR